jgi:hypothetical protein
MADPFGGPGSDIPSGGDVIKYYGRTVCVFAYILKPTADQKWAGSVSAVVCLRRCIRGGLRMSCGQQDDHQRTPLCLLVKAMMWASLPTKCVRYAPTQALAIDFAAKFLVGGQNRAQRAPASSAFATGATGRGDLLCRRGARGDDVVDDLGGDSRA